MRKFKEDSLDDFDVDGRIRRDREGQPQQIKAFMAMFRSDCWAVVRHVVSKVLESHGLKHSKYSNTDGFAIYDDNDMFGGVYKPGMTFTFRVYMGDYGLKYDDKVYCQDGPSEYFPDWLVLKGSGVWPSLRDEINQKMIEAMTSYMHMDERYGVDPTEMYKPMVKGHYSGTLNYSGCGSIRQGYWFDLQIKCPEFTIEQVQEILSSDSDFYEGVNMTKETKAKAKKLLEAIEDLYDDDVMSYDGDNMEDVDPNYLDSMPDERTSEDLQDEYMDFVSDEGAFRGQSFVDDDDFMPNTASLRAQAGFNPSLEDLNPHAGNVQSTGDIFDDEFEDGYAEFVDYDPENE